MSPGSAGCPRVVIPSGINPVAVAAVAAEQATIVRVHGTYDDAIALAAAQARSKAAPLVHDMAWPGYEQIPNWIVDGHTTMFADIEAQIIAIGAGPVDLLVTPAGASGPRPSRPWCWAHFSPSTA
jgi:diaminopropionate ammonia-lyase